MTISPFSRGSFANSSVDMFVSMRRDMTELQRQLVTGQKADSYGGLGFERRTSLDGRAKLAAIEGYTAAIGQADLRIKLMVQNLERLGKLGADTKSDLTIPKFEPLSDGRTFAQKTADQRLKEAFDLLNTDVAGRSLFAGRAVDQLPVEGYDLVMNGDGTRAGLKQLIDERMQAEVGLTGLGRTSVTRTGTTVQIAQEAAGLPFGFKVTSGASTSAAIVATTSAAPTPNVAFAVGGLPNDGETVTVTLTDPAGAEHTIRLTARTTLNSGEAATGFRIGATAAETAANLNDALVAAVRDKVATVLQPHAAMTTTEAFFGAPQPMPQRVVGTPSFKEATSLVAGTNADTIVWYKGDNDPTIDARDTAPVRIDQSQVIGAGARANEAGIRNILAQLAVIAATPFESTEGRFYTALTEQVFGKLADKPTNPKVSEIATELANASATMKAAKERHGATETMLLDAVQNVELASKEETSLAILDLQTRLQASYQTTSILSQLSLVNYL